MKKWQEMERMGAEKALVTFKIAAIEKVAFSFILLKKRNFLPLVPRASVNLSSNLLLKKTIMCVIH